MLTSLLVLGAALAWAANDVARKRLASAALAPDLLALGLTAGTVPLFLAWALLDGFHLPAAAYWLPGLGSALLQLVAYALFLLALRHSDLSRTIPLLSLTPAWTTAGAWLALGERPDGGQLAGVALVLAGAAALGGRRGWRIERGVAAMLAVSVLWAMATVLDKLCLSHATPASHSLVQGVAQSVGLGLWLVLRGGRRELPRLRPHLPAMAVVMLLTAVAFGAQMLALERTLASVVDGVKRGVGLVAAVVNGRLLFHEAITGRKVLAIGLIGTGSALLLG